jgi:hypothetical protein
MCDVSITPGTKSVDLSIRLNSAGEHDPLHKIPSGLTAVGGEEQESVVVEPAKDSYFS